MSNPTTIRNETLPSCTVILCTRRRPEKLRRCLESLRRLDYPGVSLLVIESDSAPTDSEAIARGYGAGYRLSTRRGVSAARNLGVRSSSSELLAFIDDDAVCDPDWLSASVPLFGDDRVLAVAGKVLFQAEDGRAPTPAQVYDPGDLCVGRGDPDWFEMANFGGLGLGSNVLVRRAAFDRIGLFDERLGRGAFIDFGEENNLVFRIVAAGYRVATCSRAIVRHPVLEAGSSYDDFRYISASTSMVTMIALENPQYLLRLFRYIWGAVWRKPQSWRERPPELFSGIASRWIVPFALAAGPFLYFWAALRRAIGGTPRHRTPST